MTYTKLISKSGKLYIQLNAEENSTFQPGIKEMPVDKDSEEKLQDLAQKNYLGNLGHLHHSWYSDIEKGIIIPKELVVVKDGIASILSNSIPLGQGESRTIEVPKVLTPTMNFRWAKSGFFGKELQQEFRDQDGKPEWKAINVVEL
jgi:hypothetical protein